MMEKRLDSKTLAKELDVSQASVNNWKSNRTDLGLSYLIKLCHYFGCSLDYIVGRIDQDVKPSNFDIDNFGKQLRKVMKAKNISSYLLRKDTRYNGKYFTGWDRGADPKLSTLIELANYFQCSLDELVGLE